MKRGALLLIAVAVLGVTARPSALTTCAITGTRDLGRWDDVFSYPGRDVVVLRNGPDLFSLSMTSSATPVKLAATPALTGSKIVVAGESAGHRWLFFQSTIRAPFALDLADMRQVDFPIPGARLPGKQTIVVQANVIAAHAGAAIFMIEGGDADSWPREENRPIYYWFGLASGRTVQLPVGWDLLRFSADQKTAVFWRMHGEPVARGAAEFSGRPLAAINLTTGAVSTTEVPALRPLSIDFNWTDVDAVKPLQGLTSFAGLSVNGTAYPLEVPRDGVAYLAAAQAAPNWAAFSLRPEGGTRPVTLWWAALRPNETPVRIADRPGAFEILGSTRLVYVTNAGDDRQTSAEAFLYDIRTRKSSNLLDDVERLPSLDASAVDTCCIGDTMAVRLVSGFGASKTPDLVLALFAHSRMDLRSYVPPDRLARRLPSQRWHHAVLLSEAGDRCSVDLPEPDSSAKLWLHNSGRYLVAIDEWSGATRRVHLSETAIRP